MSTCGGQGQGSFKTRFMTFAQTCPTCGGTGKAKTNACNSCKVLDMKEQKIVSKLTSRRELNDGMRMRVSNRGNIAPNGERGRFIYSNKSKRR